MSEPTTKTGGETLLIERNGEPVATLALAGSVPAISLGELVARLGGLSLPGDGFANDLETIQSSQSKVDSPISRS